MEDIFVLDLSSSAIGSCGVSTRKVIMNVAANDLISCAMTSPNTHNNYMTTLQYSCKIQSVYPCAYNFSCNCHIIFIFGANILFGYVKELYCCVPIL